MTLKQGPQDQQSTQINLAEVFEHMWEKKLLVLTSTFSFSLIAIVFSLFLKDIYEAEAVLVGVGTNYSQNIPSEVSTLANFSGFNLPSTLSSNKAPEIIEVLKSRKFFKDFLENRNILSDLMAAKEWDKNSLKLILNDTVYDDSEKKWIGESFRFGRSKPTTLEAHETFIEENLQIDYDELKGFIRIKVRHLSPAIAKNWTDWLVADVNKYFSSIEEVEVQESLIFLESRLKITQQADLRKVLFDLIGAETKKLTLINAKKDYVLRYVDPAFIPETKSEPIRSFYAVAGLIIGFLLSFLYTLISFLRIKKLS